MKTRKIAKKHNMYLKYVRNIVVVALVFLLVGGIGESLAADSLTRSYKNDGQNNPLVTQRYSADPSAMVYNDTVYIYSTNDILEYSNGQIIENSYGKITTLNCFSSKDLVNWTDHGTIQVAGNSGAARWASNSWAPCATYKKINGKDKFFLYFANSGGGIGVLTSDSPTGPWKDPIGKPLISSSTPNCWNIPWLFDPAVFVDSDGNGYLYFGGGISDGNYASPKSARVVKLGSDMTSIAGTPATIDAPYLFEDSGINKIGNKYYYSYCSNWNTSGGYNNAAIEYMVSNSPMGPFTYAGEFFKNPGVYFGVWGNNHHSIFEFKGQYYLAYHARALETAILGKNYGYRSTQIDKLTISNGTIFDMKPSMTGPSQTSYLNPYNKVEAETMAIQAGVSVSGSGDTKVTDISTGDWIGVKGVNFSNGASKISASVSSYGNGSIKVYSGSTSGRLLGTINVSNTSGQYRNVTADLSNVTGVNNLYFVFTGTMNFDYWQITGTSGEPAQTETPVKTEAPAKTETPVKTEAPVKTEDPGYNQNNTLSNGWYYIKNVNAQKYLQVANNQGGNSINVELGSGTGAEGQKWYLENLGDGYVTLKNGQGYMLDVEYGKNEDGTNIQTYSANNADAQRFKLAKTSTNNVFGIVTKVSSDKKGLDAYNFNTYDGTNICQWTYYSQSNQTWIFESCNKSESSNTNNDDANNNQNVTTKLNYKFSDSGFKNIGTLTNSISVDGLKIAATSEKPVSIMADNRTYNGTVYTKYLALGGSGNTNYRSVAFEVNGNCNINVVAKSSGTSTRYLAVCDANGTQLTKLECSSSLSKQSYSYNGAATTLYLYSTNSGINLYEMDIN